MQEVFIVEDGKSSVRAEITQQDRMFSIALDGKKYLVDAVEVEKNVYSLILEDKSFEVIVERNHDSCKIHTCGSDRELRIYDESRANQEANLKKKPPESSGKIHAPMPGKIVKILVKEGEHVSEGSGLIIIEAMKMENELKSTMQGVVSRIHVKEGRPVEGKEILLEIE